MTSHPTVPVAVIGAGPIGLAAATHLWSRGIDVVVLEAGRHAGAAVREWGHVRLFSPWSELVDPIARELLVRGGWTPPAPERYPTGAEWAAGYLQPLADALGNRVHYGSTVTAVAKQARDRLVSSGREAAPLTLHVRTASGSRLIHAAAVVDASGTWTSPNPLGSDGVVALGETEAASHITYRIPDLDDPASRARYAGKHVAVAGTGASAQGALIGLAALADAEPSTRVTWLVRRAGVSDTFGGGDLDELPERGALGARARAAVESGGVATRRGFRTTAIERAADGSLVVTSADSQVVDGVDEIVVLTGFRPDLQMLSEIRLDLDPVLQAPRGLAPLIDPNVHSCGTVYPHGVRELAQPETGFYLVGAKSYGRATSFLALTGFEQARSVAAAIAGDHEAAARVELTLPETGVCGGAGLFDDETAEGGGCCGAPQTVTIGRRPTPDRC